MRIGIDLGGTKIEGIVLDAAGEQIACARISAPRGDYAQTLHAISDLVARIDPAPEKATPVGIGIPGTISPATGLVKNANSTWLIGQPFASDLSRQLDRRVRVANDANCFAVSEATDGAGRGANLVFGAILGTGVGAGIAVGGQIVTGANAVAGEWGHTPLPWMTADEFPGRSCYCGQRGCIETMVCGPAFERDFADASSRRMTASDIATAAGNGDREADEALRRLEDRLARALSMIINIIDPDIIVLGGGLSNIGRLYLRLPELIDLHTFSDSVTTPILPAVHGDSGGVRGAAWLWPERAP